MIIKADINYIETVLNIATRLYSDSSYNSLKNEFEKILVSDNQAVFLYYKNDKCIGFAYCSIRNDYVEGSLTSPVSYLEGIYIIQEYRKQGYAKELLQECEKWSLSKKCNEFASDCKIDNTESIIFHEKTGFRIAGKIVCFIKRLV